MSKKLVRIPVLSAGFSCSERTEIAIVGASLVRKCGVYAASRYCQKRGVLADSLIVAMGCSRRLEMLELGLISWNEYQARKLP